MPNKKESVTYNVRIHRTGATEKTVSEFQIPVENPHSRILDLLLHVRQNNDQKLGFRYSCRVGMCGSCAVNVNGRERLACQTSVGELGTRTIEIQSLRSLPTRKDVVSDMTPFFDSMKKANAALNPVNPDLREIQTLPPNDKTRSDIESRNGCITCGACYSACEWTRSHKGYLGPASLNRLYMLALDERDSLGSERLKVAAAANGATRCHTVGNCSAVCPKGIPIKESLLKLKSLVGKEL